MADPIRELRAWQRFHVRITLLYAAVVLVVLTVAAALVSEVAWRQARSQLDARMRIAAQALADGLDGGWVAAQDPERPDPAFVAALNGRFARVAAPDPSMTNAYLLLWDPDPTRLRFLVDWDPTRPDDVARPGERYDGSALPVLLRGFHEATLEDQPFVDEWGPSISAYAPIRAPDGGPLALIGVDVRMAELRAERLRILGATGIAWALAAGLIGLASGVVGRNVRDPLTRVIDGTASIASGRFETRLNLDRADEFGLLSDHFDQMAEGLEERERIRDTFGRYVDPEVARRLLTEHGSELGGEEREVSVLFADLRGYTTVSERLPPAAVVGLLNTWFGAMQLELDAHDGTVIEFLGDAILAVFGAPRAQPDHADRAVRCALGMRAALAALDLDPRFGAHGLEPLSQRIGVHTGRVVAGTVGSATRRKYTVIGDTVNVAARLEQLNKELGTDLLISGATAERLPAGTLARLEDRGPTVVKGRAEPVSLWTARRSPDDS